MAEVFKIGLIGCGTVGQGVVRIIQDDADEIEKKTGIRLELARVVDKDLSQPAKVNVPKNLISSDADDIFNDDNISAVIELVGGSTAAKDFVLKAFATGKDVVTANKAMLAKHGKEIYAAARSNKRCIAFEASCGGGIPLVLPLRTGLIANRINAIYGILNGTCNYILTEMGQKNKSYAEALAEAQHAGYAEPDPTLDVNGCDTAHKLAIMASIAFCCNVDFDKLHVEGIEQLDAQDLAAGRELGYVCKLLGIAHRTDGGLSLRVHPAFIHHNHPLATTGGSFNAVSIYGNWVGHTLYYGRGAGSKPTASAVVADILDIAIGNAWRTFEKLHMLNDVTPPPQYVPMNELRTRFYLRLTVVDRPGVMAKITKVFGDRQISLRAVTQHEPVTESDTDAVPVVVLTHEAQEGKMRAALEEIANLDVVHEPPVMIRVIEEHEEYIP
ncbi:MAG: homoserine dehydrogenase [Planctomycetota bacterium]|nr:MAG: homoserine dehydrogenase [Planctomycetota bacterium]